MAITKEMLKEVEAIVSSVEVSAVEAAEHASECRRFGCGYDYD